MLCEPTLQDFLGFNQYHKTFTNYFLLNIQPQCACTRQLLVMTGGEDGPMAGFLSVTYCLRDFAVIVK